MTPDIAQAIEIELTYIMKPSWVIAHQKDHISVRVPVSRDRKFDITVLDEIWRIARFVAYSSFMSIEQTGPAEVVVTSRLPSGNGFSISFIGTA